MHTPSHSRSKAAPWLRWGAPLLAILFVLISGIRVRTLHEDVTLWNLSYTYAASQCLVDACNPYDFVALNQNAARRGWPLDVPATADSAQYPPSTLLLAVPLGTLSWPVARSVYTCVTALLLIFVFTRLLWLASVEGVWQVTLGLLAVTIAGRPLLQGLVAGNLAVPCVGCLLLGTCQLMLNTKNTASWSGPVLLALALILKPQLALGPVVLLVLKRETRSLALAAIAGFVAELFAGCAAFAIRLHGFAYLVSLSRLTRFASSRGEMLDPSPANPVAYTFLQLQALLLEIPSMHRFAANVVTALAVTLLAAFIWGISVRTHALLRRPWTLIAVCALLTLLPIYHRQYDRILVLLVLPAILELARLPRGWMIAFSTSVAAWLLWEPLLERLLRREPAFAWSVLLELFLSVLLIASLYFERRVTAGDLVAS